MVRLTKYQVELVKESTKLYDCEKQIKAPKDVFTVAKEVFRIDRQSEEIFCLLALDTKNKVIGAFEVSRGSLNSSIVHPREVFKRLLLVNASSCILIHNYPTGNTNPSQEDLNVTKRLIEGGDILGITVHDHLIIGESYMSMREEGYM